MRRPQRPGRHVTRIHELGLAGRGDDRVAGARHVADRILKPRQLHRLAHDVLHLPAGVAKQLSDAGQKVPGGLVGHRRDAEIRIAVEQAVVDVAEQHRVTTEAIGRGEPTFTAANEPLAVDQHALDQHQLAGRDAQLLGRLPGGGHGGHQVVGAGQHARGETLKTRQRLLERVVGALPGGQRLELVAEARPLPIELGESRLDLRRRRPQTERRTRGVEVLQQLACAAVAFAQQLQGHIRIVGRARRHARHLQRQQNLLLEPVEKVRVVASAVLLVEVRAYRQGEQDRRQQQPPWMPGDAPGDGASEGDIRLFRRRAGALGVDGHDRARFTKTTHPPGRKAFAVNRNVSEILAYSASFCAPKASV